MITGRPADRRDLYRSLGSHPEIEPLTCNLSIATFRYVLRLRGADRTGEEYLNKLNTEVLARIQSGGKMYPSNAIVGGIRNPGMRGEFQDDRGGHSGSSGSGCCRREGNRLRR